MHFTLKQEKKDFTKEDKTVTAKIFVRNSFPTTCAVCQSERTLPKLAM